LLGRELTGHFEAGSASDDEIEWNLGVASLGARGLFPYELKHIFYFSLNQSSLVEQARSNQEFFSQLLRELPGMFQDASLLLDNLGRMHRYIVG